MIPGLSTSITHRCSRQQALRHDLGDGHAFIENRIAFAIRKLLADEVAERRRVDRHGARRGVAPFDDDGKPATFFERDVVDGWQIAGSTGDAEAFDGGWALSKSANADTD